MADASTVSVLIQARDQASAQFQKIEGNMGKMAAGFQKHRRAIGLAATAIGGAITGIAAMSVKSSFDQQQGIRSLDQALKNVGTSYAAQKQQIEALASAQQRKTNFGDEEQRKALQELVQVSGSYDDAMAAMIPTMDLAAAKEMDLGAAATLVARAISGEETALGRYGVEVEKGAGSTAVLTEIMAKFGGQAEANADPMAQLKNRIGDLFQVLGDDLLPILENLLPKIEAATRSIIEWTEAHPTLTKVLGLTATAIGGILLVAGPLLLLLPTIVTAIGLVSVAFVKLNLSMGVITLVILAIAAVIATSIIVWKNWENWSVNVKIAIAALSVALFFILGPLALIPAAIIGIIAVIKNWDKIIVIVKDNIRKFVVNIIDMGKKFLETIRSMLTFVPGMDKIKRAIDSGISKLDSMEGAMHRWADSGGAAMGDMDDESGFLAEAIETNTDKMQTSFKETTEVITASTRGWGFEVDKATGITEEMAVRTATATRNIAEAFQEAGDEAMTAAQKIAQAERDKVAAVETASTKITNALELNAEIDAFLSRQKVENMEEEFEGVRRTTDKILAQIERSNRGLDEHGKKWEELPDAIGHALDKIPPLLGDADFEIQKTLDRIGDKLTDNIHSWGDELEGFTAEENRKLDEARDRAEKKRKDEEKDAAEAERQRMIEKFKGTPQFASMAEQREKLRSVQHALESQKGALPSMRQAITQAEAGMQQYAGTGFGASQRRQQYWTGTVRPLQDAYQRQTERIRATRYQIEALESQIAKNVIPLEYRGIAENVLAHEWMRPMQGGGIATGGLALVGERGPEVVSLPGGARVHPSGTGPGSNQFHFHGAVYGLEDLRRVVVEAVRDHALSGGFRGVFGEA